MKTIEQLRDDLAHAFDQLKSGEIKHHEADSLANLAGKMIASAKVQIEYYGLRKETPSIKFLEASRE